VPAAVRVLMFVHDIDMIATGGRGADVTDERAR
jgi:hypothetical protein